MSSRRTNTELGDFSKLKRTTIPNLPPSDPHLLEDFSKCQWANPGFREQEWREEKSVDTLPSINVMATCNPFRFGNLRRSF